VRHDHDGRDHRPLQPSYFLTALIRVRRSLAVRGKGGTARFGPQADVLYRCHQALEIRRISSVDEEDPSRDYREKVLKPG
jgi:hypothetical protein